MNTPQAQLSAQWRSEIGFLGTILGETIHDHEGIEAFQLVERIRRLSWMRRTGDAAADQELKDLFSSLDEDQIRVVVRAFTIFLDLLNLVEDRRRIQVLRQRSEAALPATRAESIGHAFAMLKANQVTRDDILELLESLNIELVFTAHPTEAKRRSVRNKLKDLRVLLSQYDGEELVHRKQEIEEAIEEEMSLLWQTNFIRPWRPSVMQEVERGLAVRGVLWETIPVIADEIRDGFSAAYQDEPLPLPRPAVTFGSWIGGDRDGHPGVTSDVTKETLHWLRTAAVELHIESCDKLFEAFTISMKKIESQAMIQNAIDTNVAKHPELSDRIAFIPPKELCRRWLAIIGWKLKRNLQHLKDESCELEYEGSGGLIEDLQVLIDSIRLSTNANSTSNPRSVKRLLAWKSQIETFGFHLAKLDIRQNSSVYRDVVNEILVKTNLHDRPSDLSESDRCKLLNDAPPLVDSIQDWSDDAKELLALFHVLHEQASSTGIDSLGAQIVSMTTQPSDILSVRWLWKLSAPTPQQGDAIPPLVPLLETIEDLKNGPEIMQALWSISDYRNKLKDDRQMIMLGYSDSTKDGGYLSACWALHRCQRSLTELAKQNGVSLTFFHGRGGSLGRGGGPAARSILSLPHQTFDGSIRITEQGEVLAERYDDPEIAHRHLEQMVWSSLLAVGSPREQTRDEWFEFISSLAEKSRQSYRKLVEHPEFVKFFRTVTPISEIEQLPIGSRPSRRKPDGGLSDLRAIPWVFSWTQCRCLLPAWYGLGSAFEASNSPVEIASFQNMYRDWPFFRSMIDNAELALAKADQAIMQEYFRLIGKSNSCGEIAEQIAQEHQASRHAVLQITGHDELLAGTSWLKESIRVRNRFIDPLNLLQIELLERWGDQKDSLSESQRHLLRLTINGVASGMRTSG